MGGKRKVTPKKAAAGPAQTATTKTEATAAAKHAEIPSQSDAQKTAADSSWEDDSWEPSTLQGQPLMIDHNMASNSTRTPQGPAAIWDVDKGSSDRKMVFYGPPVCYHCGDRGHAATGCSTPFCMSCDVWGHFKGQCTDACERCGRVHERRDGICRTFHCQICGLFGHRPTQCPGCLCDACGCYGHSNSRCPSSRTCPLCGELGHPQTSCPLLCSRCGYPGHKTGDCMLKQCDKCKLFGHLAAECLVGSDTAAAEAGEALPRQASEEAPATTAASPAAITSSWHPSEAHARDRKADTSSTHLPVAPAAEAACSNGRPGSLIAPQSGNLTAGSKSAGHQLSTVRQMAAVSHAAAPVMQTAVVNPVNVAFVGSQPCTRPPARGPPPGFQARPAAPNPLALHLGTQQQQVPVPFAGRPLHLVPGGPLLLPLGGPLQQPQEQQHILQFQSQQATTVRQLEATAAAKSTASSEDEEIEEMLGLLSV